MKTWTGALTILFEQPRGQYLPNDKDDAFISCLLSRAKEVEGPQINGVWVATFVAHATVSLDDQAIRHKAFIRKAWERYSRPVPNQAHAPDRREGAD